MKTPRHNTAAKWHWPINRKSFTVAQGASSASLCPTFIFVLSCHSKSKFHTFHVYFHMCLSVYLSITYKQCKEEVNSIRHPPFFFPYPVARSQDSLLDRLCSSFLFCLSSLTSLKINPIIHVHVFFSFRLLPLIITLMLCKRKNNQHNLSMLLPPRI